jgi:hypothetical protein
MHAQCGPTQHSHELDETHVDALARLIALRGLISPLTVRPGQEGRFGGAARTRRNSALGSYARRQ